MDSARSKHGFDFERCAAALWIAAAFVALAGCRKEELAPNSLTPVAARNVEVVEVRPQPQKESVQLIGRIEAGKQVTLYFEVPGVVSEVTVEEGDDVEPGKPIAKLVVDDYELAFARAKAEYAAARAEWELMHAGTRKEDIDLARADY